MASEQIQSLPSVILASKSKIRTRLLDSAGVKHTAFSSGIDENEIKSKLKKEKVVPVKIARVLAEIPDQRYKNEDDIRSAVRTVYLSRGVLEEDLPI